MRKAVSIAVLCMLACAHTEHVLSEAQGSPSEEFAAGSAAFSEGDLVLALAHFEAALASGLDGPAVHYNIGVCRYRLGLYSEAGTAFAWIAERYPEMRALAEYNLGLVALKQEDPRRAERHFRTALETTDDETILNLARRQLSIDREPPDDEPAPSDRLALVDAQLGYDDNVLLLADEIPLPDGQSAESRFIELWGLLSRPLADSAFRFDGNVYALRYPEASMFDQSMLQLGVPYEWVIGRWRGEAGPQVGWTTIDGDLLDRRIGINARASREIAPGTTFEMRYGHDEVDEGDSQYAFFAGKRDALELRIDRRGERGRLTLSYGVERNDRAAAAVSPRRGKWSVRYRHDVSADWLVEIEASHRDSRYGDLAEPRDEDLDEVTLGATRILPEGWLVSAGFSAASNDSVVETVRYRRKRLSVGATKQF